MKPACQTMPAADEDAGEEDGAASEPVDGDDHAAGGDGAAVLDVDVWEIAQELADIRSDWVQEAEDMFFVVSNNSEHLPRTLGRAAFEAAMLSRTLARPFCAKYRWPKQRSYAYRKHGGVPNANFLARELA